MDKRCLRKLIDLTSTTGPDDESSRSKDIVARVYEYPLARFATPAGNYDEHFGLAVSAAGMKLMLVRLG